MSGAVEIQFLDMDNRKIRNYFSLACIGETIADCIIGLEIMNERIL